MGRGGVHRREVSSHQYSGALLPYGCCGWIRTVPVLITDTDFTGPACDRDRDTTVGKVMGSQCARRWRRSERAERAKIKLGRASPMAGQVACTGQSNLALWVPFLT